MKELARKIERGREREGNAEKGRESSSGRDADWERQRMREIEIHK